MTTTTVQLAEILLELESTLTIRDDALRVYGDSLPGAGEEHYQTYTKADDKLDELRRDFASEFKELTGVDWPSIERAIECGAL